MLKTGKIAAVLIGATFSGIAQAAPIIESLNVDMSAGSSVSAADWVDVPGTERVLSFPPGTAVISWSIRAGMDAVWQFRPVVGSIQGVSGFTTPGNPSYAGSWNFNIASGMQSVKLQVKRPDGLNQGDAFGFPAFGYVSWTLIVFPDGSAPAVGAWGLALFGTLIVICATLAMRRART